MRLRNKTEQNRWVATQIIHRSSKLNTSCSSHVSWFIMRFDLNGLRDVSDCIHRKRRTLLRGLSTMANRLVIDRAVSRVLRNSCVVIAFKWEFNCYRCSPRRHFNRLHCLSTGESIEFASYFVVSLGWIRTVRHQFSHCPMETRSLEKSLLRFAVVFIIASSLGYAFGIFYYFYAAPSIETRTATVSTEPALFVISYDSFQPDYLKRGVTPHMNKFREQGVSTEFMHNVFPTKTFTNHHTLSTASDSVFQAES